MNQTNDVAGVARVDQKRGWQARAAARRAGEARKALALEARGWLCIEPSLAPRARVVLLRHVGYLRTGEAETARQARL